MDCIICAYPIDNKERLLCLTPCAHQEHVCSICFLRMRSLQRNFNCPTCKRVLDQVVCSFSEETTIAVSPDTPLSSGADAHRGGGGGGGRGRGKPKEKEKEKERDKDKEEEATTTTAPAPAAVNAGAVSAIVYPYKARFEDFNIWGDKINEPYYMYDERSQMFVPRFYYEEVIARLWEFKCKLCTARRKDFKDLRGHYYGEHKLTMCQLCIEFKQVFPAEQSVYTKQEYEAHLRSGDHDGSKGHPNCEFCRARYYDSTPLFQHLMRDHFNCHICNQQGVRFKYFNKYPDLEAHYRRDHWICEEPSCLQRGFMAFANDIDLMSHRVQFHPQLCIGNRTIPVQFKYKNSSAATNNNNNNNTHNNTSSAATTAEGEGESPTRTAHFEGGIGGRAVNGEWQVEIETKTIDPRDPNRNLLRDDVPVSAPSASAAVEDFPELPTSGAPSGTAVLNRWMSLKSAKQKKSHANPFPALPSAPKVKKASTAFAPGIVAPPRPPSAPATASSSTAAEILEDFAAVSASGSRPSTVADSLGSWANVKIDKRVPKAKKVSAPQPEQKQGVKEDTVDDDFSEDLQRALAESMRESVPGAPPAVAAVVSAPKPKSKPAVQKKAAPSSDWNDALKAVGISSAAKKKGPGMTVITANKSEADKKLMVGAAKGPASWVSLGGTGTKATEAQRPPERDHPDFPSLSASK